MKKPLLVFVYFLYFFLAKTSSAQIVINEYVPSNLSISVNGNTTYKDWIEIYNAGSSSVNLSGYGLSDDASKPYLLRFPSYTLAAHGYLVVFAADTNNTILVDHWETAVKESNSWKYFAGTSQPDTNWRNIAFNDASWSSGNGGIGFGDGDDQTTIITNAKSVMMRKTFNVPDTSAILKTIFNMDYDDGFVAFLNGVEIARANLGTVGNRPLYNDFAIASHEAIMYQGQNPDSFFIDPAFLKSILRQGVNVLAVESHNVTASSNDLSSRPFLSFGMKSSGTTFSSLPSWFGNPSKEYFSAKFNLSRTGETIYLTNTSGTSIDQQTYSDMQPDHSWGRKPDGSNTWCLIKTPTPLSSNNSSTCYSGYATAPVFSLAPGFYPSTKTLTLINSTSGGVIRYTKNGDEPTTSSPAYSSAITISNTRTIRAKVFASGYLPSQIVSNTYFINENVKLPVFCITTDSLNLWDYNTGIYVLGPNADPNSPYQNANFWQDWSKPANIEYYDKNKNRLFNFDAEIKINGNYSRAKPQKSMEISLKDKFGTGVLNYNFMPDKPFLDKTDNFILRNSGTDWNVTQFRDALMERILRTTHTGYLAAEPCVLYLNGSYWGVLQIDENHDHHWIDNNFGYNKSEVDLMKEHGSTVEQALGSSDFFWESYNYATTQSASSSQYYNTMNSYWDLDNYKDYFIAETYYNNGDWIGDWTNNIKYWRPLIPGGRLRFQVYDLDMGMGYAGSYNDNRLSMAINPASTCYSSNLFKAMLNNSQFKREFINRYADLMNTIFLPSKISPVLHQFQDSMSYDMPKHFAKWGSTMSTWQSKINVVTSFANNRPAKARDQIESQFNLHAQVTLTFNASPSSAGRIQVSTIIPESLPWSGVYFDGNPVTITAIPNPGYTFDHWSSNHGISNDHNQTTTYNFSHSTETITAYFTGSSQPTKLCVSEFNYNSSSTLNAHDWIELHNYGTTTLDLSGWKLKNQNDFDTYTFPVGTVLAPNGYLVVASDLTAFNTIYPSVNNVIGPLGFQLSNSSDQIRIFDASNQLFLSFFYLDISPWPSEPDGGGYTCELSSNTANPNDPASWFAGCIGGSPGRVYSLSISTPTHISGNSTFCPGSSTTLTFNSTPGYTYQWRRNNNDISSATDTFYTVTQSGSYTVRIIDHGCSSISDTLVVSIVTSGQAPVASSVNRCGDGSVTLSAVASDSIYWFDAPNGNIVGTGSTFTTPSLTSSTTYFVQSSLSCPSAQVAVDVVINPVTSVPVISNITQCGPGAVVLNATDTATIYWYNDAVSGALIYTGNVFVTGYIPHDTTYYLQAGDICPSERIAVDVVISSSPSPVVNTASRCGTGSLVLTASSFAPVFWFDSIVAGNQVGSGVNFLTPVLSASRTYYAESNNGCASARVPVIASVNPIPAPPTASDSIHCGGGQVSLYATSNFQVVWYSAATGGTSLGTGSLFLTPVINNTTTFYAESFDICSSSRTPVAAIIDALPPQPSGVDVSLCGSGSALLSATAGSPVYWFDQSSGGTVLGTGNSFITPVISTTTIYYAVAIANCSSLATPVTAMVTSIPLSILGNDTVVQSGNSYVLDAGSGYDSYHWSTGETTQRITINNSSIYSVEVFLNGCSFIDTISLTLVLGIQEASAIDANIHLFPNPVRDKMTIQLDSKKSRKAVVTICDIAGRELLTEDIRLISGINSNVFDMSSFASGIYILTVRSGDFMKALCITVE